MALTRGKELISSDDTQESKKDEIVAPEGYEIVYDKKGRPKKKKLKKEKQTDFSFNAYPHLLAVKPKECYIFHSDYFQIDDQYASILAFFHTDGASDNYPTFWGINRIPAGLDATVTTIGFEQVSRMSEGWIQQNQTKAEGIAQMDTNETDRAGNMRSKHSANRKLADMDLIARELQDGASYLKIQFRIMIKARTLDDLDHALQRLERMYTERFGTLNAAVYAGEERKELSTLFSMNDNKAGNGFYLTSTEFAGEYSLVTHGLEDDAGEYVGYMVGDVNNSAVLFDVDGYKAHCVVVNENFHQKLGRVRVSDMWASKISQSALMNNHKVVHIVMNGCELDKVGPKFETLTYKIDMHHGAVNMFEMFGTAEDELSVFPSQMQKLILMAEQAYDPTDSDRSIIRGSLEEIATKFYIDRRMWHENAKENRDAIRVVNIPHNEVPRLQEFVSYLETGYKQQAMASAKDDEKLHAMNVLLLTFRNMLSNNGDLFNMFTSDVIDGAKTGQRVVYDFGGLMRRGKGVAMAQLVNIIGFALGNLGLGDTVIIHGTDLIDDGVKDYINTQFAHLFAKGGRVAYIYDSTDAMLADKNFCHFDRADYTIFGNMTDTDVAEYQKLLGQDIPPDLARLITNKSDTVCYIRRGFDNVVFKQDLILGLGMKKKKAANGLKHKKRRLGN